MRKLDNTNFEQANIEYIQFWMMSPFLDPDHPNRDGGDLYLNFGEISEDILKDGLKSYENGIPYDGNDQYLTETVWGRVSKQNSLTYAFDNNAGARLVQDVGLDGLKNDDEFNFNSYRDYIDKLRQRLPASTIAVMQADQFSPMNDRPATTITLPRRDTTKNDCRYWNGTSTTTALKATPCRRKTLQTRCTSRLVRDPMSRI